MTHAATQAEIESWVYEAYKTQSNLRTSIEPKNIRAMAERINKLAETVSKAIGVMEMDTATYAESCDVAKAMLRQALADYRGTKE